MRRTEEHDPYEDEYDTTDEENDSYFPWAPTTYFGWPSGLYPGRSADDPTTDDEFQDGRVAPAETTGDDDRLWEEGLATLMLLGGGVLLLFPEPLTSAIGLLLVISGIILWTIDLLTAD